MSSVAVLLDGGCVRHGLYRLLHRHATANDIRTFAEACVAFDKGETLFRIFYYDAQPYAGPVRNPLSGSEDDFSKTSTARRMDTLLREVARSENMAFRSGLLSCRGYCLKEGILDELAGSPRALSADDIKPVFVQKQIDMKIGLDVAWLASRRIVDRIVLVTADRDFIPAMKFARREGLQVVLVDMGLGIDKQMKEHSDYHRNVTFPVS